MKRSLLLIGLVVLVLIGGALFVVLPNDDDESANNAALKSITGAGLAGHRLQVEGVTMPGAYTVSGGHPKAELVNDGAGGLSPVTFKFEPYVAKTNVFPPAWASWLSENAAGAPRMKSGSFTRVSSTGTVAEVSSFNNALLSEVVVPGCKPGSTSAAEFSYSLQPAETKRAATGSLPSLPKSTPIAINQCRVEISNIDTKSVSDVSSFQLAWHVIEVVSATGGPTYRLGEMRDIRLSVSAPEASGTADQLRAWATDFVRGTNAERDMALVYLDSAGTEVARFSMRNCGVFRTGGTVIGSGAHFTTFLYCERLTGASAK